MRPEAKRQNAPVKQIAPLERYLSLFPCEELVEIDLIQNQCRSVRHTEGKYFAPLDGEPIGTLSA